MKVFFTVLAVAAALLLQSALSMVLPAGARVFDPFLLVLVYCGLSFGETHGMLAGGAAGWAQDCFFGGQHTLGLSGLTKVLVGFAVGLAATRFQLTEAGPRLLVLVAAVVVDVLLLGALAAMFDITVGRPSLAGLAGRATLNAVLGVVLFGIVERRLMSRRRP